MACGEGKNEGKVRRDLQMSKIFRTFAVWLWGGIVSTTQQTTMDN